MPTAVGIPKEIKDQEGRVSMQPDAVAELVHHGHEIIVQSGSYVASNTDITVESKWGGAKTFFGGEGLFMLKCRGNGTLIISSYGAIHRVSVPAGQNYVVDTGHIVAFSGAMQYNVRKFAGWKSTILGGEGLVVDFTGPGDLYIQTRSPEAFLSWLVPKLPRSSND